jgi:phytoene/squalene synthetase
VVVQVCFTGLSLPANGFHFSLDQQKKIQQKHILRDIRPVITDTSKGCNPVWRGTMKAQQDKIDSASNHTFSSLFAGSAGFKDSRRTQAFSSLYSFMRIVDDLADQLVESPELTPAARREIESQITRWEKQIGYCYAANRDTSRTDLSLLKAVALFQIPDRIWREFFYAMTLPVTSRGFETIEEMFAYSRGAAAAPLTVFLMICFAEPGEDGIFYIRDMEKIYLAGESLGIWSFMIHVLSVAKSYLLRSESPRNLFPLELMENHGISLKELTEMARAGQADQRFRKMVKSFLNVAMDNGRLGLAFTRSRCLELPQDCCKALAVPLTLYNRHALLIQKTGFDVFNDETLFNPGNHLDIISQIEECKTIADLKDLW